VENGQKYDKFSQMSYLIGRTSFARLLVNEGGNETIIYDDDVNKSSNSD
jgi:hypothetical protein